jgi:electron transfer flavoprotein-quinone oxidoreductase
MDKTTCIVVGAGPAGAACAYALATKGIETVLLERGREPGEKNVAAFVLFTDVLEHLIPDFMDDAPFERNIVRTDQVLLGEKDAKLITSFNCRGGDAARLSCHAERGTGGDCDRL